MGAAGVPTGYDSRADWGKGRTVKPVKPGTIKKFIAKVKKYATWARKQITKDYNPIAKGTALNP